MTIFVSIQCEATMKNIALTKFCRVLWKNSASKYSFSPKIKASSGHNNQKLELEEKNCFMHQYNLLQLSTT